MAFGYLSALNSLLQYGLIQSLTPDNFLGRINGLWTAQNVVGDALGALLLGDGRLHAAGDERQRFRLRRGGAWHPVAVRHDRFAPVTLHKPEPQPATEK